jgi:tetrapyrrole methylase family protein / MazG family protein
MLPLITVVGLGPAGPELLTDAARQAIANHQFRYLRTKRHPAAPVVGDAVSFDHIYDHSDTFAQVYEQIVEELVTAATQHGSVLYAVPGSPVVAEDSVALLLADTRVRVELVAALSFLDLAWVRLGVDPLATGVRIVDAHRFTMEAAGERGPLLVAQCHDASVLSDVKLSLDNAGLQVVTILHHLGLADEEIRTVAWAELDHFTRADHLTSLWIPKMQSPVAGELVGLIELVRTLREHCPWDAEQTPLTLRRYVVEEAYELVDALNHAAACVGGDGTEDAAAEHHVIDELGDVLFQVLFHAVIGEEEGRFTLADVATTLHAKLVHRHPHVFPRHDFETGAIDSPDDVVANWERIKTDEKSSSGGITETLPSLQFAAKVLKRHPNAVVADVSVTDESILGERLLALVAAARKLGVDAEIALRTAAERLRTTQERGDNRIP